MVIKGKLTLLQKSAGKVVGQFEVTIWMPNQPRRYSDDITEASATALGSVLTASLHVSSFDDFIGCSYSQTDPTLGKYSLPPGPVTLLLLQEGRKKLICEGRVYCSQRIVFGKHSLLVAQRYIRNCQVVVRLPEIGL